MGDLSNSDNRPIFYPLSTTLQPIGSNIPNEPIQQISWPDIPNDERIAVTIQVSLDEYVALASAVDVGSDIAYGEESQQIWWIWNRAIIMDICEQIAACIDNDSSATALSLNQFLSRNGYSANFRDVNDASPLYGSSSMDDNLIPIDFPCDEPHLMALCRTIVRELNESTEDLLQVIELVTSSVELAEIVTQYFPIVGVFVEFAGWLQNTLAEFYSASYDQAVEDEIACAMFCIAINDCELSLNDMLGVYTDLFDEITPPLNTESAEALLSWATELELTVNISTVAAFHWLILQAMRYGGGLQGFAGIGDLTSTIKQVRGYTDYSYEDCECAEPQTPTDFWKIETDLRLGSGVWQITQGTPTSAGVTSTTSSSINQCVLDILDLGDSFATKAAGVLNQRRGSTGNGSDFDRIQAYPNVNIGGTPQDIAYNAFKTCNTNACTTQESLGFGITQPARSIRLICRDNGTYQFGTNFVKAIKVVVFGLCNTGQVKPSQAVYIDEIPPVGTYFD